MRTDVLVAILAGAASAAYCDPVATVEVFDDAGFTRRFGVMHSPLKTLYVRIQCSPPTDGYMGVELSLAGLHDFVSAMLGFSTQPTVVLGSFAAPEDRQTWFSRS